MARKAHRGIVSLSARLATKAPGGALGSRFVAQGIRWPQRHADAASHILGRDGARRSATDGQLARLRSYRTHDHSMRNGGPEKALHPENSERRGNLVPGLLRA